MDNAFKFVGTAKPYRRLARTLGWGDFFVANPKRTGRKQPLHPGDCPFCGISENRTHKGWPGQVSHGDDEYLIVRNKNPIVRRQRLIIPAGVDRGSHSVHRLDLNANDVCLALRLARTGFSGLLPHAEDRPWACYVNAFPGTGRSIAHLHINAVPGSHVPLLQETAAEWQICGDRATGSTISRLAGVDFYALTVDSPDAMRLAAIVADLHRHMNEWQQPYNFLLVPGSGSRSARVVIVPRDAEYCEAADQRIGGLEFLTGVLIPGNARVNVIDTILRDRALRQATLKHERRLQLERQLRGVYGLPPGGFMVTARAESRIYEPVLEPNDILEKSVPSRPSERQTDPPPVFGEIDRRHWILPRTDDAGSDFHERRVNANVLVRITRASICQSDRRVLGKEKQAGDMEGLALGHEGGGYIVDPGPWTSELMSGEKVVVLPHLSCGECDDCHRYMPNLCRRMEHLGFHLHGNLADLMAFPYQCVLPIGSDFPDDAMPLVEPLSCVLRALFRIRVAVRGLADESDEPQQAQRCFTIFGGGPMGCLTALAVRRNWRSVRVRIVESNATRRSAIEASWPNAFEVLAEAGPDPPSAITFVASSNIGAVEDAIRTTDFGGTVLLFAGINKDEQDRSNLDFHGQQLEKIHRREQSDLVQHDYGFRIRFIGSSGYILDDVKRSLIELRHYYDSHYRPIQNVAVSGLAGSSIAYIAETNPRQLGRPAVPALLSPKGADDPLVASSLKVLIRLSESA
jgi:threonine dehydrogenase-like Zn-dependent dehydrogenase